MTHTIFFTAPGGTLSHHRLHDRPSVQLQLGITAFEAGLHSKDSDETTSKSHFLQAKQHLNNSRVDKNSGSLAHCYLTLIQFYENHEIRHPDIIEELLLVSQYINSVGSDGLKLMPQNFKIPLLEMIEKINNGAFLEGQLIEKAREYKQNLESELKSWRGREQVYVKANAYFQEGKEKIATIQAARVLLEKDENEAGLQSVQQCAQ